MLRRVIVALTIMWAGIGSVFAQATGFEDYDRVVAFGDSLTDNGNLFATTGNPPAPYTNGRFSNGEVWLEQLLGPMNSPVQGTGVTGNVNLAFGGARADNDANTNGPVPSMQAQIGIFLASGGSFGANDIVVAWAGANDLFQAVPLATGQPDLIAAGVNTANDQLANLNTLAGAGAKTILLPNLPNFGAAPSFNGTAQSSGAGFLATKTYNDQLAANAAAIAASDPTLNIIQVDINAAFNAVLENPAAFGFTNVTDQCLTTIACVTGSQDVQNQFLFWDGVHPTEAGHALIAQYTTLLLNTDKTAAATAPVSSTGVQAMMGISNTVFDRNQAWVDGTYAQENGFHAEVIGLRGDLDATGNRSAYTYGLYGIRAGLDRQFGNTLAGASAAILTGGTNASGFSSEAMVFQGNIYGTALFGPLYVTGVAGMAFATYNEMERATGVGSTVAVGETSASQYGLSGEIGAVLPIGNGLTLTPSVRAGYVDATVDGYAESGPILAMSYSDRNTDLTFWAAELRASANVSMGAMPTSLYGEVGYEDFISYNSGPLTASLVGNTALPVSVSIDDPEARGFYLRAGMNSRVSETMSFDVDYGVSLNNGEGEVHTGKVRVKIGLGH